VTAFIAWILLRDRADRTVVQDDEGVRDVALVVLLLPVLITFGSPILVWLMAREAGGDRWTALMATTVAVGLLYLAAAYIGAWWAVALAFGLGILTMGMIAFIGARTRP
jgi:hypothetical protein